VYCLKCGSEVQLPNVFCSPCLEDMATCPVRSDAVIHLPERPTPVTEKKSRKKSRSAEDRIRSLRRFALLLCILVVALSVVISMLTYQLIRQQELLSKKEEAPLGKNFTTQESTEAPTTTPEPTPEPTPAPTTTPPPNSLT